MKLINLIVATSLFFLAGCKPDSLRLDVYTEDVNLASKGEIMEVPVQVTFSVLGDDDENLLSRAATAAKKYLHPKSSFSESNAMMGRELVIDTKLPMGRSEEVEVYLTSNYRLAALIVSEEKVTLKTTGLLKSLDHELKSMNLMLGAKLPAGDTKFNLISDSRNPVAVSATAVFVSGKPYLEFSKILERRGSVEVVFKGGDDSVYSEIAPSVLLRESGAQRL